MEVEINAAVRKSKVQIKVKMAPAVACEMGMLSLEMKYIWANPPPVCDGVTAPRKILPYAALAEVRYLMRGFIIRMMKKMRKPEISPSRQDMHKAMPSIQ